jgi:MoaD family protein
MKRDTMKLRVQFYAHLRDVVGVRELNVEFAEGATVGDLLQEIYTQQPALLPYDKSILIGAGVEFADRNYELKPGEEIAIMPPVQGG